MKKKCICGNTVIIPKKTEKKIVKCECGAIAPLKKRNGRVRGLRFRFHKPIWHF